MQICGFKKPLANYFMRNTASLPGNENCHWAINTGKMLAHILCEISHPLKVCQTSNLFPVFACLWSAFFPLCTQKIEASADNSSTSSTKRKDLWTWVSLAHLVEKGMLYSEQKLTPCPCIEWYLLLSPSGAQPLILSPLTQTLHPNNH